MPRADPAGRFPPGLGVALGATALSFASVFVEGIDRADLGPTGIAFLRTALGAVFLFAVARARGERLRPTGRGLAWLVPAGALFAGDLWVWHRSILLVGGGIATILMSTQVLWVGVVGVLLLRERGGRRLWGSLALALAGIALLTGVVGGAGAARADPLGVALGLATGGFYASYLFVVRRARRAEERLGPFALMAWLSLASALVSGILSQADGTRVWPARWETWGALLGLACVGQGFGWVTISTFLPRVPMSRAGLLLLLQPTFAALWAALFFGRHLTLPALVGAVLALAGVYGGSVPGYGPSASDRDRGAA